MQLRGEVQMTKKLKVFDGAVKVHYLFTILGFLFYF
jgi:hypothetical protein